MQFPARVTLASEAVVLLDNSSQMDALPIGVAFEPIGAQVGDRHAYREVPLSRAVDVQQLRAELQAAADALLMAAKVLKDGQATPMKANHIRQAAERAMQVLADA